MTVTSAQLLLLRRMIGEPTLETYSDAELVDVIESHPLMDEQGEDPYTWDNTTTPPSQDVNEDWVPTYDLNASAADIWTEKAGVWATKYDFQADGGNYSVSQAYQQCMKQARYYGSRRAVKTIKQIKKPDETTNSIWIGNLAEDD